jgi:formate/nitrite transporter FocA (FNT family)
MPLPKLNWRPRRGAVALAEGQAAPQLDLERPTAHAIYEQVEKNGRQELNRNTGSLAVSGLAGGMGMGLTALATAIATAQLGNGPAQQFIVHMLYPIGFIVVILGRAQLFTENTLYPVALVMAERGYVLQTLRLWATVLPANIAGALLFALLVVKTGALRPEFVTAMAQIGKDAAGGTPAHIFWSGVIGGWIIAMVAWLVSSSHSITGSIALIWLLTFVVGLGGFAHCIASSGEIFSAVLSHQLGWLNYLRWIVPAVAGNICGGVLLVTLFEYGQTQNDV